MFNNNNNYYYYFYYYHYCLMHYIHFMNAVLMNRPRMQINCENKTKKTL